ncbi:endolytic transglycosylase MltG [Conexibacter sp. SYSU D00693]|uniref:endolytic transglycosylase MltG n=1 Tax=Conexibacter sp. SYSU D00693 TaxID=2812560 RepID=UPI00196B412D|nr:endolytic transglycosylase MltG [Conexibacter sp. SYSU D00693]
MPAEPPTSPAPAEAQPPAEARQRGQAPESQEAWFSEPAAPPPPPPPPLRREPAAEPEPVVEHHEPVHVEPEPEPVEPVEPEPVTQVTSDEPIGVRRATAPSVRDLPRVSGPTHKTPRAPKPARRRGTPGDRRGARRAVAAVLLVGLLAVAWFLASLFQPFSGDGKGSVRITVPPGSDIGAIGDLLEQRGVISSGFFFELRARLSGDGESLRAGSHVFRRDMSYGAALDVLTAPAEAPKVIRVTIPEGRARTEIVPLLEESGLKGSFLRASDRHRGFSTRRYGAPTSTKTLEGFLYPATYELKVGSTAGDLVGKQLDAFTEVARDTRLRSRARRLGLDAYEVLTIASMIEREVLVPRERRLISAVIHNRLEQGIPLGIDATIRYERRNWTRPLRQSELDADTPYNTRKRRGLPPTPIGNPSRPSIEAALRPAKNDYLYYVVRPCGNGAHAFSSTDAGFQEDVAAYNRAREARGGKDPSDC